MSDSNGICHMTKMEYCAGDVDDTGRFEEWLECSHCGHTCDVPPKPKRETPND